MSEREEEVQEVIQEALEFLNNLTSFRGRGPEGLKILYEASDAVETMYYPCGSSPEHGNGVMLRVEGGEVRIVNPSEDFVDGSGQPATRIDGEDGKFFIFWWSLFDPRKVMQHLKETKVFYYVHGDGNKMLIGKLDLAGMGAPPDFIEYIKDGGNPEPEVRLYFKKDNTLTQMVIVQIMPRELEEDQESDEINLSYTF